MKKFTFTFLLFALFSGFMNAQVVPIPQGQGILPDDYGIADLSVVDENIVWAFATNSASNDGNFGLASKRVIRSVNGGESWEVHSLEALTDRNIVSLSAVNDNIAWISANDSLANRYFYQTIDGGANWEEKYSFAGNPNSLWAPTLKFIDENRGYFVSIPSGKAGKTTDGGETWTSYNSLPGFDGFWGVPCAQCWLEVKGDSMWYGNSRFIAGSTDGGANWETFPFFGNNVITSIAFDNNGYGLAIADTDADLPFEDVDLDHTIIWKSENFGETWVLSSFPDFPLTNIAAIPGEGQTFVAVSGAWGWHRPDIWQQSWALAFTEDGGLSWTEIDRDIPYRCVNFASVDAGWVGTVGNFDYGFAPGNKPAVFKLQIINGTKSVNLDAGLTIFPNPAKDFLNIGLHENSSQLLEVNIFDAHGRLAKQQLVSEGQSIKIVDLPNGFYTLKLTDGEHVYLGKFFKE